MGEKAESTAIISSCLGCGHPTTQLVRAKIGAVTMTGSMHDLWSEFDLGTAYICPMCYPKIQVPRVTFEIEQ